MEGTRDASVPCWLQLANRKRVIKPIHEYFLRATTGMCVVIEVLLDEDNSLA
jgi:hypothetical protein